MQVSYHRLEPLFSSAGSEGQRTGALSWRYRRALWLGGEQVLVFGSDAFGAVDSEDFEAIEAGASLVDTATWSSCKLDASAGGAAFVAGRVLVYGRGQPASRGLRAYTVEGREAFHLLDREHVWGVQAAGDVAYVRTRSTVYVVDVRTGSVLRKIVPPPELVDVIVGAR